MSDERGAKYGTGRVESDLILAALDNDWDEIESLLKELSSLEKRKLHAAANTLRFEITASVSGDRNATRRNM